MSLFDDPDKDVPPPSLKKEPGELPPPFGSPQSPSSGPQQPPFGPARHPPGPAAGPAGWAPPTAGPAPYYGPPGPYGAPGYYPAPYLPPRQPDEPTATTALILGIVSVVGTFTFCVGFLASPAAIYFGHRSRRRIREANGELGGDSAALAGLICGYVGLAIGILVVTAIVIALATGGFDASYGE